MIFRRLFWWHDSLLRHPSPGHLRILLFISLINLLPHTLKAQTTHASTESTIDSEPTSEAFFRQAKIVVVDADTANPTSPEAEQEEIQRGKEDFVDILRALGSGYKKDTEILFNWIVQDDDLQEQEKIQTTIQAFIDKILADLKVSHDEEQRHLGDLFQNRVKIKVSSQPSLTTLAGTPQPAEALITLDMPANHPDGCSQEKSLITQAKEACISRIGLLYEKSRARMDDFVKKSFQWYAKNPRKADHRIAFVRSTILFAMILHYNGRALLPTSTSILAFMTRIATACFADYALVINRMRYTEFKRNYSPSRLMRGTLRLPITFWNFSRGRKQSRFPQESATNMTLGLSERFARLMERHIDPRVMTKMLLIDLPVNAGLILTAQSLNYVMNPAAFSSPFLLQNILITGVVSVLESLTATKADFHGYRAYRNDHLSKDQLVAIQQTIGQVAFLRTAFLQIMNNEHSPVAGVMAAILTAAVLGMRKALAIWEERQNGLLTPGAAQPFVEQDITRRTVDTPVPEPLCIEIFQPAVK